MSDGLKVQGEVSMSAGNTNDVLDGISNKAAKMAVNMAEAGAKAGKAIDEIGEAVKASDEKFTRAESSIVASAKRFAVEIAKGTKSASDALGQLDFNIAAKGLDQAKFAPMQEALRKLGAEYKTLATAQTQFAAASGATSEKINAAFGSRLQNASYQMQDFIVQVNGGVDATKALGMQLPQMLVGFGAAGAAIGVVAALLPNLVQAFGNSAAGAKDFKEAMSDFDKAIGDVGSTVKSFDMEKLYEQFNDSSSAVRAATIEQVRFQQELIKTQQLVAEKKFGEQISGLGSFGTLDKLAGSFASSGSEKLAKQLGISAELAKDLLPALNGLKSGTEDVNNVFNKFGRSLLSGNASALELAQTIGNLAKTQRDEYAALSASSEAQERMSKGHVNTKKEADEAAKARDKAAKAAEAEAKALENLLDSINGKSSQFDSSYVQNVETLLKAYDKGKLSLSGFNEVFSRYVAMQPGAIAAAKELAKAEESRSKYLASVEDETEKLVEKAKASEYELSLIGKSADEIERLTAARYDEKIELLQDKIAAIESLEGRNAEVEAIYRQIEALHRLKSAEIAKPKLQQQAREWENFARDIERSLTDALYRSFEAGGSFAENFSKTLENTLKAALAKALIQTTITTGANTLNGVINALAGTSGSNGGAGTNYLGLANNANSVYNIGSAAVNTYGALTTGAGAISGTATLANMYGAAGGDSLGAFIAMNPQWASTASSAGAAAGAEAGASAGSASASASSAASYAGYAAALYQAYKGDYASASLTATGTYIGSMFGPWGAAIGALVGTLIGSFIQPGGGPKDNNRYSYSEGNYERLSGGSAGVLKEYSASAADQINGLAAMYGNDTRIAGREAWLSLDPRGTASTQLNLELFDQIGRKLYSRMDEYGGNIENVGRSSASLQENMARTMRDAVLLAVARADIGDAVTVALFDQFESGIKDLSATQGDMVIGALKMGWLDDVLGVVDEAQIGLSGVADAVANLMSIVPMKKVFDDLGVSIFAIGAQTESTLPALDSLKKTITGADGAQVTETFRETYLRTVNEFVAVGNMLDAMGMKVSEAFDMSNVNNVLAMSDALVQLFGTVEDMGKSFGAYYENFYTSAEKTARSWELMQRSFDALNLTMPTTRQGFRDLVEGLDLNTTSGVQTFKALMDLQAGFAALTPTLDSVAESAQQAAASERARVVAMRKAMEEANASYATSLIEKASLAAPASSAYGMYGSRDLLAAFGLGANGVADQEGQTKLLKTLDYAASRALIARVQAMSQIIEGDSETIDSAIRTYILKSGGEAGGAVVKLIKKVSENALRIGNAGDTVQAIQDFVLRKSIKNSVYRQTYEGIVSGTPRPAGNINSGAGAELAWEAARITALQYYKQSQAPGIASFLAEKLNYDAIRDTTVAYGKVVEELNKRFRDGQIDAQTMAEQLGYFHEVAKNAGAVLSGTMDYWSARQKAMIEVQSAANASARYYFGELHKWAKEIEAAAKQASAPVSQLATALSSLSSIQYAFGTPLAYMTNSKDKAVAGAISGAAADAQTWLNTQTGTAMSNKYAGDSRFAGVNWQTIGPIFDQITAWNIPGFQSGFVQLSDALSQGSITVEQYNLLMQDAKSEFLGLADSASSAANSVNNLISALGASAESMQRMIDPTRIDREYAQAKIETALAIAKASGTLPNLDSISGSLNILGQDSTGMFGNREDYMRDFYRAQNNVIELKQYAESHPDATTRDVVVELQRLNEEVANLRAEQAATARAAARTASILQSVTPDGDSISMVAA